MASARMLGRIDALAWTLIFAGLFTLALGIAAHGETVVGSWSLSVLGGLATAAGIVLVVVRSRLPEDAPGEDAQSPP